ncbi:MAG: helix-turn-helix domain-containing protein [Deltaproteobacteria bacterium]|nr:helix-turn-helix domain-containing protein [Deltaproteobacteria bacterium]
MTTTAELSTIARRVSYARGLRGLSLRRLASGAGVSHGTIFAMESRDADDASVSTIRALARVLDVHPAWLAFGIGAAPRPEEPAPEPRR